jgi:hypothetical protein
MKPASKLLRGGKQPLHEIPCNPPREGEQTVANEQLAEPELRNLIPCLLAGDHRHSDASDRYKETPTGEVTGVPARVSSVPEVWEGAQPHQASDSELNQYTGR